MSEHNVIINNMEFINITYCEISKCVNEHGDAVIKGYIVEDKEAEVEAAIRREDIIYISARDQDDCTKIIFSGIITKYEAIHKANYCEIEFKVMGLTYKMNLVKRSRIFQSLAETYEEVLSMADSVSGATHMINDDVSGSIGHMVVQYKETDWEFVKRMASEKNSYLIPDYQSGQCVYYTGVSGSGKSVSLNEVVYTKKFDINSYKLKNESGLSLMQEDETQYIVKIRDNIEIGNLVILSGELLYVYSVRGLLEGAQMLNEYVLKPKGGFKSIPIKNYNIIGASLSGNVKEVKNDKIRVNVTMEGHQADGKWFDFATVYSSNDNAGWYCMPEIEDSVRIYFPSEVEDEAYVYNAMHIEKAGKDPSIKFFRNPQGKEMVFAPEYLLITNNAGMSIKMHDEEGITIKSNKAVSVKADENIHIESNKDKVCIDSNDGIEMKQGNSSIIVNEEVAIKGTQVHIQECVK